MERRSSSPLLVGPAELGESLRALRLGSEDTVGQMTDSLARHGQLTALTAFAPTPGRLELADGFKRLSAARRLDWDALRVDVLDIDVVQAKAALAQLNQANALSELEEAWLCRSLYREDKLTQPQIGRLLRRHKAWVCRRLALAEGLDETVEADVRLGLVAARAAYEVTRLPRGNQREVAELVMRRGLTVGQTARLCTALLACGDPAARRVLLCEAQEGTGAPPARAARRQRSPGEKLVDDVSAVTQLLARLQARLCATPLSSLGEAAAAQVTSALIALEPALVALSGTIAKVRGGRHAHLA